MRIRIAVLGLAVAGLIATGCSSTRISGSWKSPEYTSKVKKVYIIGIAKDETRRRIFEDEFRKQLAPHGVTSISSYRDLAVSEEPNKDVIAAKIKANGADSALLARVIGRRTEQVTNPGRISSYGYGPDYYGGRGYYPDPYYRNYGNFYSHSREIIYQPATITEFEVVTIEANLYDAVTTELIWSAQLETVIEVSLEYVITGFIKTVTKDLKSKGLI